MTGIAGSSDRRRLRDGARDPESPETFGPLAVRRMRKDDGRSLLVYEHDPRQEGFGEASARLAGVSELRFNELRGEEVAYAIHRQDRTFLPDREHCPLDPTRPGGPPTEIPLESFEIVVFDNRFPAFEAPHGAAEVVVYTDDHEGSFGSLPAARAEALMWVWRHRYAELGAREDVEYVYIFENRGVEVGVTLHHPHGQIYGYPFLPPVPALEQAADARLGGCAPCALLARERAAATRLLLENEAVVGYVPEAARWPYEAHLAMLAAPPLAARLRARGAASARLRRCSASSGVTTRCSRAPCPT